MLSFLQHERNRRALALLLAAVLVLSPLSALAGTYDIEDGDITVTATLEGEQNVQKVNGTQDDETIVITGTTGGDSPNTLTLNAGAGATVQVTVKDLHIQIDENDRRAAVTTTGEGSVVIELDGENTLTAGYEHAGLQKENGGTLTIQDESGTAGTLTATGGESGAGIGGAYDWISDDPHPDASNIIITGGTIVATGGEEAAGIGGGCRGSGTDITITGGTVTATGGDCGAGIGGGDTGSGTDITITGGTVKATGGSWAAGIGGGDGGDGTDITISGGTVVANGGSHGAGIGAGGGTDKVGSDITISGGTVVAVSPEVGAGIGGGSAGTAGDITVSGDAQVSVAGGDTYRPLSNYFTRGSGAGIGDGGKQNHDPAADPIPGQEAAPDTEGLTCGQIDYYTNGTTVKQIQDGTVTPTKTVYGSGHAPGEPKKENEVAGNCTTDGGYDLVTYCTSCGTKLSSEHTNTGIAHTPGEPQKENEIAGDCVTDGGYDLVTYCTACGNELSRQHTNTGKVADAHDWVIDEAKAPTCTATGLTEGKHCSRCTAKVEQQVVPAMNHDWVIDEAKAPTCTATGLTEGKHCSRCPEKVEQQTVPANGHTPGEAVKENEAAPQVGVAGSYDEVVYCTVCEVELSRTAKTVPALEPEPEPTPVVVDDPFTAFCKALAHRIRTAPENGAVEADGATWPGLQRIVLEALADRPDVTLILTCRVNGQSTELTVPAGTDLLTPLGNRDMLTFEEIVKILG